MNLVGYQDDAENDAEGEAESVADSGVEGENEGDFEEDLSEGIEQTVVDDATKDFVQALQEAITEQEYAAVEMKEGGRVEVPKFHSLERSPPTNFEDINTVENEISPLITAFIASHKGSVDILDEVPIVLAREIFFLTLWTFQCMVDST